VNREKIALDGRERRAAESKMLEERKKNPETKPEFRIKTMKEINQPTVVVAPSSSGNKRRKKEEDNTKATFSIVGQVPKSSTLVTVEDTDYQNLMQQACRDKLCEERRARQTAAQQAKLDAASIALNSCSVDGCNKTYLFAAGKCRTHYIEAKGWSCSVDGCKKPYFAAGKCETHYRAREWKYTCSTENCPNKLKQEGEFCTTCTLKKKYAK
jgi:hypothetical protein